MDIDESQFLIEVLYDANANVSEKDDAAMDLSEYNSPEVIKALLAKGADGSESPVILNSCGESLAEIWVRNNAFDKEAFKTLQPAARAGFFLIIKDKKPEWQSLCSEY